ncbi:MAG TPA: 1-aminocyclopropane-1-carboxylate deaminase/D-cysteine desulfhydrase [Gammaproteobacteria bacterium]|nr:1-aminocyclopropane-1-carboxylate deaminase/D-cysteine desulfhydrase [Gammaproteobacteria bacterium]
MIRPACRPLQKIEDKILDKAGVRLLIKREDQVHPVISGNKWHKLKYNLEVAQAQGHDKLLSFGGAYSNHIHALAGAGKAYNFNTIGMIRGEAYNPLNPTLQFAIDQGMQLHYLSRSDYRHKYEPEILDQLKERFGEFYLIPEGGSNALAVKGCREIIADINVPFDVITSPCGTGGTLAGLIAGLECKKKAVGFAVLKGAHFLQDDIAQLLRDANEPGFENWEVNLDYHFGGYAKTKPELLSFIDEFEAQHNIPLEPIYTGKMMYGLFDLIRQGKFPRGTIIVAIHTGGLQGKKSKFKDFTNALQLN